MWVRKVLELQIKYHFEVIESASLYKKNDWADSTCDTRHLGFVVLVEDKKIEEKNEFTKISATFWTVGPIFMVMAFENQDFGMNTKVVGEQVEASPFDGDIDWRSLQTTKDAFLS